MTSMESGGLLGDFLSPESTVTTLLSSSGHLRSSLAPEHNTTIRYKDKDYTSASEALDAYIADFERSRQDGELSAGRLVLPGGRSATPARPRTTMLRNRDVLRERLTDRELDFLTLPVSSLRHHGNRDRLSMTTEELLSIPCDGSMPVTHTSAFIQGLLSQPAGAPLMKPGPSRLRDGAGFGGAPCLRRQDPAVRSRRMARSRGDPGGAAVSRPDSDVSKLSSFKAAGGESGLEFPAAASSSLHFPRWFTSHKSDMDFSGVSSVPDLTYPAWIHSCENNEDHAPSWVAELEDEEAKHKHTPAETLRDLRLQFAEQISLVASDRKQRSDVMDSLFRDNKIESLIHKAETVLNSLSESARGDQDSLPHPPASPGNPVTCSVDPISPGVSEDPVCSQQSAAASPAGTEELLDAQRSWDSPPFSLKPAGPAGGVTESLTDTEGKGSSSRASSGGKLPGPVEALKQMLFRLQAVEAEVERRQRQKPSSSLAPTHTGGLEPGETPLKQVTEADAESQQPECFPGGPSLQRALHHLERLKILVEEPKERKREEEEEKDRDEGLCSC